MCPHSQHEHESSSNDNDEPDIVTALPHFADSAGVTVPTGPVPQQSSGTLRDHATSEITVEVPARPPELPPAAARALRLLLHATNNHSDNTNTDEEGAP
ncbi:hypothetical protein [Parasphingorhabdus pacifica]